MASRMGCGLAFQCGQETDAVLSRVVGQIEANDVCRRRREIEQADGMIIGGTAFHLRGPLDEERHAMPTVEDVRLVATEVVARIVAMLGEGLVVGAGRAAVVAGDHDDRVVGDTAFLERGDDLANGVIGLHDEVGIQADAAFALPLLARQDGRVRRVQRQVEEEGFVGCGVVAE